MASEEMGLTDLLKHGLEDMYYAEARIQKALPKMIAAAQDAELKRGLERHLEETAEQITMLEEAFEAMGEKPRSEKCDAMDGILKEGDSLLQDFGGTAAGDAAIIGASRRGTTSSGSPRRGTASAVSRSMACAS